MAIVHSLYPESGKVHINDELCTNCGQCAKTCPADVLEMREGKLCVLETTPFGCIGCAHCMMVCPEGSIEVSGRGLSPADLLELPPKEQRASAEALEALLRSRRSIRRFSDREVSTETIDKVVEMASSAPMGIPPWDVGCSIIQGREKVQETAAEIIKGYEGFRKLFRPWVLKLLRPFMGKATFEMFDSFILPLANVYVDEFHKGRDVLFWDAPVVLVFHHSSYCDHADAFIACTYAMLAAESLGLGSTIIGGAPPILQRNKKLCEKLGIPAGSKPAVSIILGYPVVPFRRAVRRRFTSISRA